MYQIGIIEDNDQFRRDFQAWFSGQSAAIECVAAFSSVEKFMKYHDPEQPLQVLMLDIGLPGINGIDAIPMLKKKLPDEADIVMYSSMHDPDAIFKALCAGATGYLLKNQSLKKLEEGLLQLIEEGGAPLSPSIARRIVQYFTPAKPVRNPTEEMELKPVERQIVHFLIEGKTWPEIAERMSLSVQGAKYHQKSIFRKLNISSRNELQKGHFV